MYFTPERTRVLLAGRTEGVANVMAASLGVVTPFCSCSAVPLFIGFVQAGVPLGVTLSFLISAPMVNEVALTLLFGLFGWRIALLYLGLGLSVAIVAGWVIGRLRLERWVEEWVYKTPTGNAGEDGPLTWSDRVGLGRDAVPELFVPLSQAGGVAGRFIVRTQGDPAQLAEILAQIGCRDLP